MMILCDLTNTLRFYITYVKFLYIFEVDFFFSFFTHLEKLFNDQSEKAVTKLIDEDILKT